MDNDAQMPKKKKLPFKPTALKKRDQKSNEGKGKERDSVDFFKRSAELKPLLAAEAEKRARREAEKERRTRRTPSPEKHERPDGIDEHGAEELSHSQKKRRVDEGLEDDMYDCTPPPRSPISTQSSTRRGAKSETTNINTPTPSRRLEKLATSVEWTSKASLDSPSARNSAITILSDDGCNDSDDDKDDNDDVVFAGERRTPRKPANEPAEAKGDAQSDADSVILADDGGDQEPEVNPALQAMIDKVRMEQQAAQSENRDVHIQITTVMTDAADMMREQLGVKGFQAKLSYDGQMKNAKDHWCNWLAHNGLEGVDPARVFFTWRGNQLYNSTTAQSLGICFTGTKRMFAGDWGDTSGFTEDRRRVILEAWTEEAWVEHKLELEAEKQRAQDKEKQGEGGGEEEVSLKKEETQPAQEARIKVTIRPKQGELLKASVPATGRVGDLATKFREKRHIPADMAVTICFEGEKLADGMSLEDAEIADGDQVEVILG